MSLFKKIFGLQSPKDLAPETLIEAKACPNCWGRESYGDEFKAFVEDPTKANINQDHQNKKAFIAQFVETHVTGIRLKREGDQLFCPSCKTRYKYLSSKTN